MICDAAAEICEHPDDHAGEMETSLIMAFRPELVMKTEAGELRADEGARRKLRFKALSEGWVGISRPWHLLTTNTGSGNPHEATADKGRRLTDEIVNRIAPFLVELAQAEVDDFFPFEDAFED